MNFFEELLSSYDDLKQRKFKLHIDEAVKPLDPQAESIAKQYIQQAMSKQGQPDNKVMIPELGGAQIWVAIEGKAAGQVVFNGFPGFRQGRAMPVNPDGKSGASYQNYAEFVGLFSQGQGQGGEQVQPGQEQEQAGDQNPLQAKLQTSNPAIADNLFRAYSHTVELLKSDFFIKNPQKPQSWQEEGPDGQYRMASMKFAGGNGSLEMKLAEAVGIQDDGTGILTHVPLYDADKVMATNIVKDALKIFTKFKSGTFTNDDAFWISSHIVSDDTGVWFKDDKFLPYGMCFFWQKGYTESNDKFFANMVESYNKNYEQWCDENKTDPTHIINKRNLKNTNNPSSNQLNAIRGNTAEMLQIAIHSLYKGDKARAYKILKEMQQTFGANLMMAWSTVEDFKNDRGVATENTMEFDQLIGNLRTVAKSDPNSPIDDRIFHTILKKVAQIDKKSLFIRSPLDITHMGNKKKKGLKADQMESYGDSMRATEGLLNMGFSRDEIKGIVYGDKVNVGLKTYLKPGNVEQGKSTFDNLLKSLRFTDNEYTGFMNRMAAKIGIQDRKGLASKGEEIQKDMDVITQSFSKVKFPRGSSMEARERAVSVINSYIQNNFGYNDLISSKTLEGFDFTDERSAQDFRLFLQRKVMTTKIKAKIKQNPESREWKEFLAMMIASTAGAEQNQIDDVRYLSTMESLVVNHNDTVLEPVRQYLEGIYSLDLDSNSNNFTIKDERGRPVLIQKIAPQKDAKKGSRNVQRTYLTEGYIREKRKKPLHESSDLMTQFLEGQQRLLESLLKQKLSGKI